MSAQPEPHGGDHQPIGAEPVSDDRVDSGTSHTAAETIETIDPDSDSDSLALSRASSQRPVHLRWSSIGLVALGGAVGTAVRAVLAAAFPDAHGISWIIFWINVIGAFALGGLIESLARRGPDIGRRRRVRLLIGTGVLGGFTTYSTLAVDTAKLLVEGRWGPGAGYAGLTVVSGVVAAALGIVAAARLSARTPSEEAVR
ncbi:fluoride efflux transporter FluC [Curtobacterium ammoniigenes]|uniref:fluoride efflux transporter FluC n=1 Tax=Curtobacterium ammoniigenes TaxID=395387 RepID=UPI0009FABDA9|nr:CrcB family protein [Curtobacterium ammoniigenes]